VKRARVALPLLLALAGAAHAADWHLPPTLSLNGEYNDNPWLRYQGVKAVTGGVLDISLPLQAKSERTEFQAVADSRLVRYNDPLFSHNDGKLDLSLKDVGERSIFAGTANWTHDTTLTSELGTTGLTDVDKRHTHFDVSLSPQVRLSAHDLMGLSLAGQSNHYEEAALTGLVAYRYASALVSYQRQTAPVTLIGVGVQAGKLFVPERTALESTNGVLRFSVSHAFSERLSLDAFAGPTLARQHALETRGGAGQFAVKYGGLRTDFSLQIGRQLTPTGYGTLTEQTSVAVSMARRLTEKFSSVTTLSYLDTNYLFGTTSTAFHYRVYDWRVDQGLTWQWTERVAVTLAASETRQAIDLVTSHADRFTANLGISWTPRRLF
jgi:hypothetical protein